jgi:aminoglycoside 2'-N-acetyltransferase I
MACVTEVRVAHTADLDATALGAARALLDAVFGDEMTAHDWDHALGGIHALVWDGDG